jgi:hypothetical protein
VRSHGTDFLFSSAESAERAAFMKCRSFTFREAHLLLALCAIGHVFMKDKNYGFETDGVKAGYLRDTYILTLIT